MLPWDFINRPKSDGTVTRDLVQCRDLPNDYARDTVDNFNLTCAQMDKREAQEFASE